MKILVLYLNLLKVTRHKEGTQRHTKNPVSRPSFVWVTLTPIGPFTLLLPPVMNQK